MKVFGVQKMLTLCKNDKDTFIEWLRLLNKTYLSNVECVQELETLFKAKKEASTQKSPAPAPEAPSVPANDSVIVEEIKPVMIDTKATDDTIAT